MSLKEAAVVSGMSITSLKVATHRASKSTQTAGRAGWREMTETHDLIESLRRMLRPASIRSPLVRAAWLLLAAGVMGLLGIEQAFGRTSVLSCRSLLSS